MDQRLNIFLSSTSEMQEEWKSLDAVLSHDIFHLYWFTEDPPDGRTPEERCRANIEESHLFVIALGKKYGTIFPGDPQNRSVVEWEFDIAAENKVPIMPFVKTVDPKEQPQIEFINKVINIASGRGYQTFDSPPQFAARAQSAILRWLVRVKTAIKSHEEMLVQRYWPRLLLIALGAVTSLIVSGLLLLNDKVTRVSVIAFSATVVIVVVMALVLTMLITDKDRGNKL